MPAKAPLCTTIITWTMGAALFLGTHKSHAQPYPAKIAVVPGMDIRAVTTPFNDPKRVMGIVAGHLENAGLIVIIPPGGKGPKDSATPHMQLFQEHAVDAVCLVRVKKHIRKTPDGLFKTRITAEGEILGNRGRDLGTGTSLTITTTRRGRENSVMIAEKEVGRRLGRALTRDPLTQRLESQGHSIHIRLDGAARYEVPEVFGNVINSLSGVTHTRRTYSHTDPGNPRASKTLWEVLISRPDPFHLQTTLMQKLGEVSGPVKNIFKGEAPVSLSPENIKRLKMIRPGTATSRELRFVMDP